MTSSQPQPEELQIAMLGASRVGKTSLLAAIYSQFANIIGAVGQLELIPDVASNTSALLAERLAELTTLADEIVVKPEKGTRGTADVREFIFSIKERGSENGLRLRFVDYPGGYLGADSTKEEKTFVINLLKSSDAVLIAIDAAALMETDTRNRSWHGAINRSQQITDLFKFAYNNLTSPRLVILCPVKCEKYMLPFQDLRRKPEDGDASPNNLQARVEYEYRNLISYFQTQPTNIATVITPVQTTGCVFYARIEYEIDDVNQKSPRFRFVRRGGRRAEYNPKDSEQPLLWLLPFLLQASILKRPWYKKFVLWVLDLDKNIKSSLKLLEGKRKRSDGFKLIQGEHLVEIK